MSTMVWNKAHVKEGLFDFHVDSRFEGGDGMDRQTDQVSEDIILFQREYDEAHAEEEKILDNWINKSSWWTFMHVQLMILMVRRKMVEPT